MNYTSLEFFILFVMTAGLYSCARAERARFWILLASSLVFYYWAGAFDFLIFSAVVLISYLSVYLARRYPGRRRAFLYAGIAVLLTHLFAWKYFPWIAGFFGKDVALPLPLGISFFTLQGVAYLVDFLRREADFLSLREFFLFKSFFAQLIAGPIVRAYEVVPYLRKPPRATKDQVLEGLFRICLGLVKKLVIADHMGIFVETVFSNPSSFTPGTLALGGMAFYFQIWGDFSGYTDIGRGCALLLGWRLPENFYSPVYALGPTEWARRWHVTLGRWMLLYVYVPVASVVRLWLKRFGLGRDYRWLKQTISLAVTLLAVGLWHGAAWNYFAYGLALCFLFYCEIILRRLRPLYKNVHPLALALLAYLFFFPAEIGMSIIFRSQSLMSMGHHFAGMFLPMPGTVSLVPYADSIFWRIVFVFGLEAVMYFDLRERRYPIAEFLGQFVTPVTKRWPRLSGVATGLLLAAVFVGAIAMRSGDQINGFIYFGF